MNKTIVRSISLILALTLTFAKFTSGQAKSILSAAAPTFVAEADSRVHEANPNTNYGKYGTVLYVEGGTNPDIESYFRFTVTGISGPVSNAKLRVYVTNGTSNGPAAYTTSNDWTETGITWNNRPARTSGPLDDKAALGVNIWVEYDVTAVIRGNGTYSFVLATDSPDGMTLSSLEGSSPPQLVVTGAEAPTSVPPSATPQATASPLPTAIPPTNTLAAPTSTAVAPIITSTAVPSSPTAIPPTTTPTTVLPSATVIPATTIPTTALPNTNPINPTVTSTPVSVQPTATPTSQTSSSTTQTRGTGMWISSTELMSLPTSGAAWDKMRTTAYGSWGTADLKNQDNKHAINTLAGALAYARTGDTALRGKVRDGILTAKRTLDESSEWQTTNGVLAAARQLGAYVIAADLIDLKNYDAPADNEFRSWLSAIRTTNIGTHSRWKAIKYTCENAAANWSAFACASRIAAGIYLGDTADVQRSASILRAFLGERNFYPADAPGKYGYFQHTANYLSSWACNEATWTGINPPCAKSGVNLDGVLVEEASRGSECCTLQGAGISYSWETLQGLFVSAELLYRAGSYGDPYSWSNQALKRALDAMQRYGWGITGPATYVPWMANLRYGTNYFKGSSSSGRIMSWGDWLYQR